MARIPPYQNERNALVTIGTSNVEIAPACRGDLVRTSFVVTNVSTIAVATIACGELAAVATQGRTMLPSGAYIESTDAGSSCWQGAIQCISDVAGTVAITERFEILTQ